MRIFGYNISVTKSENTPLSQKAGERRNSDRITGITPGRVSVPDDNLGSEIYTLRDFTSMVNPSFRVEIIQLIRNLYKVNPDVGKAVRDMYQLTNTGHQILFPNNTDKEAKEMNDHLSKVTKKWSNYTAGIDGLVNRMVVQAFIGGAISIEGVPNQDLTGLATVLFVKPETIVFRRENNGVYQPYQRNNDFLRINKDYIKLNTQTYKYISIFNDTDEPYGIPLFMMALDSIKTQADMKVNIKHIMENAGMLGFMEVLIAKDDQRGNESVERYKRRLSNELLTAKRNLKEGMKDGIVVGFKDDHEFNLHSTTKEMGNMDKPWNMNQQSVANGLGVNSSLIGVSTANTEGGAGINLSTLLSQLKNLQTLLSNALEFLYTLELRLAGFNCKGIKIYWYPATVSDDVKIQQARQYKVQVLNALYRDGIINLLQYAQEMGYDTPDQDEPRVPLEQQSGNSPTISDEDKDKDTKNKSARRSRDKDNPVPKRKDQNPKAR